MSNPWLKKNPFMSMWLSWANWMVGTMSGQMTGQAKRQINSAVTKATNDNVKAIMLGAAAPASSKARTRRDR